MIAILMSTYNGEKYLREQIESFFSQTEKDWQLYIRDDGSKDNTCRLISEYVRKFPQKIHLVDDIKTNLGPGKSFMHLLKVVDADYYMFSDQDDVWMDDKIEKTLKKLKSIEKKCIKEMPIGIFTDLTIVDSELNIIHPSLWKAGNRHPEYVRDLYLQWSNRHATYGCTMMINKFAKKVVLPYKQFPGVMGAHDNWIAYILIHDGIYDYLNESTIYYRQHGNNVVGANLSLKDKDEVNDMLFRPFTLWAKLKKDYARTRLMPFYVSYLKVLLYRVVMSTKALLKK